MAEDPTLWTPICKMALALLGQTLPTDIETDGTAEAALCLAWTHQICDEVLQEWPFACILERAELSEDMTVLTGTIDPAASTTVTGVGTLFLTELEVGDRILVTGETRTVASIVSNLELTVTEAFSNNANDLSPEKYQTPVFGYAYQFDLPTSPYCLRVVEMDEEDYDEWKIEGRKLLTDSSTANILYIARPIDYDPTNFDAKLQAVLAARFAVLLAIPVGGDFKRMLEMQEVYKVALAEAKSSNPRKKSAPATDLSSYRSL